MHARKRRTVDSAPIWAPYFGAFSSLFIFLCMLDVYWRMKGVLVEVLLPIQFAVVLFSVRQMMVHRDLRARIDAERIYDKTIS